MDVVNANHKEWMINNVEDAHSGMDNRRDARKNRRQHMVDPRSLRFPGSMKSMPTICLKSDLKQPEAVALAPVSGNNWAHDRDHDVRKKQVVPREVQPKEMRVTDKPRFRF